MQTIINLNGRLLGREEAYISVFDHGFLYGDSIFETLRTHDGKPFLLHPHIDRLFRSASLIGLTLPWGKEEIIAQIDRTLEKAGIPDAYVRVIITRGEGEIGLDPDFCSKPTLIIIVKKHPDYGEASYTEGVKIALVETRKNLSAALNPLLKSGNYLGNVLAFAQAKKAGAVEGVMLNADGFITEATHSNIFIVLDGCIKTPRKETGLMPGVTRNLIISIIKENELSFEEGLLRPSDLLESQECFLTSTTRGIMPVRFCNETRIGADCPGEITRRLMDLFSRKVGEILSTNP
jgi:branched-chain amino acid aminotransferase